jgi:hypothetical protein
MTDHQPNKCDIINKLTQPCTHFLFIILITKMMLIQLSTCVNKTLIIQEIQLLSMLV